MVHSIKRACTTAFICIVTALFIAFSVSNRDVVSISFFPLPYAADLPKFLLLLICFSLGAIVGGLTISMSLIKAKRVARSEKIRAAALQNELKLTRQEQSDRTAALPQLP